VFHSTPWTSVIYCSVAPGWWPMRTLECQKWHDDTHKCHSKLYSGDSLRHLAIAPIHNQHLCFLRLVLVFLDCTTQKDPHGYKVFFVAIEFLGFLWQIVLVFNPTISDSVFHVFDVTHWGTTRDPPKANYSPTWESYFEPIDGKSWVYTIIRARILHPVFWCSHVGMELVPLGAGKQLGVTTYSRSIIK